MNKTTSGVWETIKRIEEATNMVAIIASIKNDEESMSVSIGNVDDKNARYVQMIGAITKEDCNMLGIDIENPEPWRVDGGMDSIPSKTVIHWFKISCGNESVNNNNTFVREFVRRKEEMLSVHDECVKRANEATREFVSWFEKSAANMTEDEMREFMLSDNELIDNEEKLAVRVVRNLAKLIKNV